MHMHIRRIAQDQKWFHDKMLCCIAPSRIIRMVLGRNGNRADYTESQKRALQDPTRPTESYGDNGQTRIC